MCQLFKQLPDQRCVQVSCSVTNTTNSSVHRGCCPPSQCTSSSMVNTSYNAVNLQSLVTLFSLILLQCIKIEVAPDHIHTLAYSSVSATQLALTHIRIYMHEAQKSCYHVMMGDYRSLCTWRHTITFGV